MATPDLDEIDGEPITVDGIQSILAWLDEEEYGSFDHTVVQLIWRTGLGSYDLRALDLGDYDSENQRLHLVNRRDTCTKIVRGSLGERVLALNEETCEILDTYLEEHRHDVIDEHSREPLLTTTYGRPSRTTIRRHVLRATQPCERTGECPYNVPPEECEARGYGAKGAACPSSGAPAAVRETMIEHWADDLGLASVVRDRALASDAATDGLHYDSTDDVEQAERRRREIHDETNLNDRLDFDLLSPAHARRTLLALLGHQDGKGPSKELKEETWKFQYWCSKNDIEMMNELTPSLVDEYLDWRESKESGAPWPHKQVYWSLLVRLLIMLNDWHEFRTASMQSPTLESEPCVDPTHEIGGQEIDVSSGEQYEMDLGISPRMSEEDE